MRVFDLKLYLVFLFCLLTAGRLTGQHWAEVNTDWTKMRNCESVKCRVLMSLRKGDVCKIMDSGLLEDVDSYGTNAWLRVNFEGHNGYVYSPLLDPIQDLGNSIKVEKQGSVTGTSVNVRYCPDTRCGATFALYRGDPIYIIRMTKRKQNIQPLGSHPWYYIEYNGKRGFVFGALVQEDGQSVVAESLTLDTSRVSLYDVPNGRMVGIVKNGRSYPILRKSAESEVVRPYGRHYWYEISDRGQSIGWVFGGLTSKSGEAVDCQCVDFIKHSLDITGPTKNAFEWNQVLTGLIPVTLRGRRTFLDYQEIPTLDSARAGDLVVFDKFHPEVHEDYGHIGIFVKKKKLNNNRFVLTVEGGNHDGSNLNYYHKERCNNVSKKEYRHIAPDIRFFRQRK